jgi:FdhD protein
MDRISVNQLRKHFSVFLEFRIWLLYLKLYKEVHSLFIQEDRVTEEPDFVVVESVLELRVNNEFLTAFICSPGQERELALGYFISSGFLQSKDDIIKLDYANYVCEVELENGVSLRANQGFSQLRRFSGTEYSAPDVLRELRTGGELPTIIKSTSVKAETIFAASRTLKDSQTVFQKTGATHAALLCQISGQNTFTAEDIGRHNAVDKVIGLASENDIELGNCFLFVSGRLTADMVSKCAWCGIPLVASNSATTDSGIKFAKKSNITLIGFQRGNRFRVYHEGAANIKIEN